MDNFYGITILGLGPGDPKYLTLETWAIINEIDCIYLRTMQHPAVAGFPKKLKIQSFDEYYRNIDNFEEVYEKITEEIVNLAETDKNVVYAVPGHPFVAEATTPLIIRSAREKGIPVRVLEAVSFLEPTFKALEIDPFDGVVLLDSFEVGAAYFPPFPPNRHLLISQVYSRMIASEVKQTLATLFPDEHPVKLVHNAGTSQELVESLKLYEIDRSRNIGLLTTLYVQPFPINTSFEEFQDVIAHLRAPEGCPWDRDQDHQTLRAHLLSETYEVLAAIDDDDPESLKEELGDLLLQIVLHAQIASEYGEFNMSDVIRGIIEKLIRRHPHVFTNLEVDGVNTVLTNWEKIKQDERNRGVGKKKNGILSGVPIDYPALAQAQEIQNRAARVGFDWHSVEPVIQKIHEEFEEIVNSENAEDRLKELGDLLFAIVNLIRWYKGDAESILRETNAKFRNRFNFIEEEIKKINKEMIDFSLEELDQYWNQAKKSGL